MTRIVAGSVVRAVPRLGLIWDGVERSVSGPLHRLVPGAPAFDGVLPPGMLTAWWRLSAAVRSEQERPPNPDGLLDTDHGSDGELLHLLSGVRTRAAGVLAAHERVGGRVARMWAAAAE